MVDEQRVQRLLRRVLTDVSTLHTLGAAPFGAASAGPDAIRLAAAKYTFITAIEGCTRVAQHIAASEGWRAPESNADAFVVLAERAVLEQTLAQKLARASGFRNLLVHQYADVDDTRVVQMLGELDDLEAFVAALRLWVVAQRA